MELESPKFTLLGAPDQTRPAHFVAGVISTDNWGMNDLRDRLRCLRAEPDPKFTIRCDIRIDVQPGAGDPERTCKCDARLITGRQGNEAVPSERSRTERRRVLSYDLLLRMLRSGTTVVECKSGYGLSTEAEMKLLRVLERAKRELTFVDISSTYCGAHAIPK